MSDSFYHIAPKNQYPWMKSNTMVVGTSITTGEVNPFFNYFLEFPDVRIDVVVNGVNEKWTKLRFLNELKYGRMNTSYTVQQIAAIGQDAAMHFCKYTRELIWENIRASDFPNLPSRQKCIWLAHGDENLKYWVDTLPARRETHRIYKVVPTGKLHYASDEHLLDDSELYPETLAKAKKYWGGIITDKHAQEILFEGTLDIIEEIDYFS